MAAEGAAAGSRVDGEWTEELEAAVRRQVVSAMDNYPPQESGALLDALVGAAARGVADGERSLITDLQAANNYKMAHFEEEPPTSSKTSPDSERSRSPGPPAPGRAGSRRRRTAR